MNWLKIVRTDNVKTLSLCLLCFSKEHLKIDTNAVWHRRVSVLHILFESFYCICYVHRHSSRVSLESYLFNGVPLLNDVHGAWGNHQSQSCTIPAWSQLKRNVLHTAMREMAKITMVDRLIDGAITGTRCFRFHFFAVDFICILPKTNR